MLHVLFWFHPGRSNAGAVCQRWWHCWLGPGVLLESQLSRRHRLAFEHFFLRYFEISFEIVPGFVGCGFGMPLVCVACKDGGASDDD